MPLNSQPSTSANPDPAKPLDASQLPGPLGAQLPTPGSPLNPPEPRASGVTNQQINARSTSTPLNSQPPVLHSLGEGGSTINIPPASAPEDSLPLYKGESEEAYEAFCAFLSLGPGRSHQKAAELTSAKISNIRYWSAKFRWKERIELLNARKLQRLLNAKAETQSSAAIDWAKRSQEQNELQWDAGNELVLAAKDCLRDFLAHPESMSLGQIADALEVGSKISHLAVQRATSTSETLGQDVATLRKQLEASLKKAHPPKTQPEPDSTPAPPAESPPP
jgi:hypothetical protein